MSKPGRVIPAPLALLANSLVAGALVAIALLANALVASMLVASGQVALAADISVAAGRGTLAKAIASASAGDTLLLSAGLYRGAVTVDRPLTLSGRGKAQIDGDGSGSVINVLAANVTLEDLHIVGSGDSHDDIDSGIKLGATATNAVVRRNELHGNLYGIDVHGAHDAQVSDNLIIGRTDNVMNRRGNGIYIWNAPGTTVRGNKVQQGRDGIFINTSHHNTLSDNHFENLRFAIHYMYANDSVVSGNFSSGNHLGYAIMFSNHVVIRDNISLNDRDYGIMLNYANNADITGNAVVGGGEKCLFVYNANKNTLQGNHLQGCPIGIHFTGGSERNKITGNAFVGNRTQIKFVSTRDHVWSGNYWSDHAAYDVNADGIADQPFRPNDAIDLILWTQPSAKVLLGSPALQLIRWAQKNFPALLPGGIVDDQPLMAPQALSTAVTQWKETLQ